jgi:hypothetical protein
MSRLNINKCHSCSKRFHFSNAYSLMFLYLYGSFSFGWSSYISSRSSSFYLSRISLFSCIFFGFLILNFPVFSGLFHGSYRTFHGSPTVELCISPFLLGYSHSLSFQYFFISLLSFDSSVFYHIFYLTLNYIFPIFLPFYFLSINNFHFIFIFFSLSLYFHFSFL